MTKPENHKCGIDCGGGAWCIYEPTSTAYQFENERYNDIKNVAAVAEQLGINYSTPFAEKVLAITDAIAELLVTKNAAYGDSALNPVRIFSTASTEEQLLVRLDDKLSRIARGHEFGEDVLDDLIGYAILLKIARMEENTNE